MDSLSKSLIRFVTSPPLLLLLRVLEVGLGTGFVFLGDNLVLEADLGTDLVFFGDTLLWSLLLGDWAMGQAEAMEGALVCGVAVG